MRLLSILSILFIEQAFSSGLPKVIRLGQTTGAGGRPITGGSVWSYVENEGLLETEFKKDGVKIEWIHFLGAGPARNEAFANKLLDFSSQGDQPLLVGVAGGLKLKVVATSGVRGTHALIVPPDSRISKIEDLRGKRVAVFKGTNIHVAFDRVLETHGLSEKDIKVVAMNGVAGPAALASRSIDALYTGSASAITYQDQGIGRIVYNSTKDQVYATGGYIVTEEFEKQHPEAVQRIVNVLVKAAATVSDPKNRDAVFKSWSKSGFAYSSYKRDFEGKELKTLSSPLIDQYFRSEFKRVAGDLYRFKLLRTQVNVEALYEPKYLDKALKDLKLENSWK